MTAEIFDSTPCKLGEGPFWHPIRKQFFWFDILNKKLRSNTGSKPIHWQFDEFVSAAGVIDENRLLIASESQLFVYDLENETKTHLVDLEVDNPITRSNDGRVDTLGGMWIGTMGKNAEPNAGAIYRYYKGELRRLFAEISISNAICFSSDGAFAYFTDTPTRKIMRQQLDSQDGWPVGEPQVWLDLNDDELNPDGAIVDTQGNLWNAQWGASRVAVYSPEGAFIRAINVDASQATCPAFGGAGLGDLLVTSACIGISASQLGDESRDGMTFLVNGAGVGQPENLVKL